MSDIKNSTAYYGGPMVDEGLAELFKKAIAKAWKISKIEVLGPGKLKDTVLSGTYSVFEFIDVVYESSTRGRNYKRFFIYSLVRNGGSKKQDKIEIVKMEIELSSSGSATPGTFKCYLSLISNSLLQKVHRSYSQDEFNDALLKKIANDTLFISKDLIYGNGFSNGKDLLEQDLMKDYKYKYQFIKNKKLTNKILNTEKDLFIFVYAYLDCKQSVIVFEANSGNVVYANYTANNCGGQGPSDFRKLSKKIEEVSGK